MISRIVELARTLFNFVFFRNSAKQKESAARAPSSNPPFPAGEIGESRKISSKVIPDENCSSSLNYPSSSSLPKSNAGKLAEGKVLGEANTLKLLRAVEHFTPDERAVKSNMVHFHTIFSNSEGGRLVLGNDQTRELLSEAKTNKIGLLPYESLDFLGLARIAFEKEKKEVSQVDLLITLNGIVSEDALSGAQIVKPHRRLEIDGLEHIPFPISKEISDSAAIFTASEIERLKEIFVKIDGYLDSNRTVFLHCSQGDSRSAAVLVLYIASRTLGLTFENVHAFVASKREIEPYSSDREMLMTKVHQFYEQSE